MIKSLHFFLKMLVVVVFSSLIIYTYYYKFPFHQENFDGYMAYITIITICYFLYKACTFYMYQKELRFSIFGIILFGLGHLFILCCIFFILSGVPFLSGIALFFKIITYLLLPTFFMLLSYSVGSKVIEYIKIYHKIGGYTQCCVSIMLGFTILVLILSVLSFFGLYTFWSVVIVMLLGILLSYRYIIHAYGFVFEPSIVLNNHDISKGSSLTQKINPYLLSTEFLFLLITFIISINFISIVRPMPIGWDDLGAYMNQPNLIAQAGESLFLGGMNSWQMFTGLGFLFSGNTQAFFMNNVGVFISSIFLFFMLHDFLRNKKKHTLVNIPFIIVFLFISMPMVVFQQAKDMKLDIGLFGLTVGIIYILYRVCMYLQNEEKVSIRNTVSLFAVIGVILGFLFTVKFTALITIISALGVICYFYFRVVGLLGFLFILSGAFTITGLWDKLNVIVPSGNQGLIWGGLFILGGIACFTCLMKCISSVNWKQGFLSILAVIVGIIIAVFPWVGKNIYQVHIYDKPISVSALLSGASQGSGIDVHDLYTAEEIKKIVEKEKLQNSLKSDGVNNNEDYGRYLGYETGINNYIKMPYNLTMQVNQRGEFTNIGYLFLVLVPLSLLFLPYKKPYFYIVSVVTLMFCLMFLAHTPAGIYLSSILSGIHLPAGYLFIFLLIFIPAIYLLYVVKDCNKGTIIKLNIVYTSIFTFFFVISSYGIIWYGIGMFVGFLLTIAFMLYYITRHGEGEDHIYAWIGTSIVSIVIGIFIFGSVIPSGFNNMETAGFHEYKMGTYSQERGIFKYQERYLKTIAELNLGDNSDAAVTSSINSADQSLIQFLGTLNFDITDITVLNNILNQIINSGNPDIISLRGPAMNLQQDIFSQILSPQNEYKNTSKIYRVGTFLTFFVSENMNRVFSDGLLNKYDSYIFDDDHDVSVERLKKLGIEYILLDLNTATIDNDPRQALVKRYEKTLSQLIHNDLELVDTDSLCLKLAHEDYRLGNTEVFMEYAGVNYGSSEQRYKKISSCHQRILDLYSTEQITHTQYSFLLPLSNYIKSKAEVFSDSQEITYFMQSQVNHGYFALYKMK